MPFASATAEQHAGPVRPRVIVSADYPPLDVIPGKACGSSPPERCSDPDDVQSMVRLLLYANELEVEGLVASAGTFANIARKQNILDTLDLYYTGMFWNMRGSEPALADRAWIDTNVREGHGPLGAAYPGSGFDPAHPGQQEGDTPSFLHLVSAVRGLNDPDQPDQGGWGGRFVRPDLSKNHWFDDPAGPRSVFRWRPEVQEEFAERADWMLP